MSTKEPTLRELIARLIRPEAEAKANIYTDGWNAALREVLHQLAALPSPPDIHRGDIVRAVKDIRAAETLAQAADLAILLLVKPAPATQGFSTNPERP